MLKNMRHKHEYRGNTSKGLSFLPQEVRNSIFGIEMGMSLYVNIQVITPRYIQIYNKDKHRNRDMRRRKKSNVIFFSSGIYPACI
jgi:hypothetical protein